MTLQNSMSEKNREFQVLLHELQTQSCPQSTDWSTALQSIETCLYDQFSQPDEYLEELHRIAPHWERESEKLRAGRQLLLMELDELRAAVSDSRRIGELPALFSRWAAHYRVHEHDENRLVQLSCTIDIGGEGG